MVFIAVIKGDLHHYYDYYDNLYARCYCTGASIWVLPQLQLCLVEHVLHSLMKGVGDEQYIQYITFVLSYSDYDIYSRA